MPVLARFGQFRQFTRQPLRRAPGGWISVRYFLGAAGGVRPVIRAANSSSGEMSVAAFPMVWSSIHLQLSTRNVAENWLRRVVGYA